MRKNTSAKLLALALAVTMTVPQVGVSAQAAKKNVKPQSIEITTNHVALIKGKTKQLRAVVGPKTATNKKVIWTTNNKKVVTVSKTGKIKGIANGRARIYAKTSNGIVTYTSVKVGPAVSSVTVNKKDLSLTVGKTAVVKGTVSPKNAAATNVKYFSSNKKIATVGMTGGKVTAKAPGTAKITVKSTDGTNKKAVITVTVKSAAKVTKITSKDVVNGTVNLSGKTYENLAIDKSVNDAQINLDNVTVKGSLTMADGVAYTITAKNSTIANVVCTDAAVVSKMADTKKYPVFIVADGTKIINIQLKANAKFVQKGDASIQKVLILPDTNEKLVAELEGIKGSIELKSAKNAEISISMKNCKIPEANVIGKATGQKISLTDAKGTGDTASVITNLNLAAGAQLTIGVNAKEINIADTADKSIIEVTKGTTVDKMTSKADEVAIKGDGQVKEAEVSGDNTRIDTKGTEVKVDQDAKGTTAGDKAIAGGSTTTTPGTPDGSINGGGSSGGGGGSQTTTVAISDVAVSSATTVKITLQQTIANIAAGDFKVGEKTATAVNLDSGSTYSVTFGEGVFSKSEISTITFSKSGYATQQADAVWFTDLTPKLRGTGPAPAGDPTGSSQKDNAATYNYQTDYTAMGITSEFGTNKAVLTVPSDFNDKGKEALVRQTGNTEHGAEPKTAYVGIALPTVTSAKKILYTSSLSGLKNAKVENAMNIGVDFAGVENTTPIQYVGVAAGAAKDWKASGATSFTNYYVWYGDDGKVIGYSKVDYERKVGSAQDGSSEATAGLDSINAAANADALQALIDNPDNKLGLDLTDYQSFSSDQKKAVAGETFAKKPNGGYTSLGNFSTEFKKDVKTIKDAVALSGDADKLASYKGTLAEAITAAGETGTVTMLKDSDVTTIQEIGKAITLDGDGKVIKSPLKITAAATVKNIKIETNTPDAADTTSGKNEVDGIWIKDGVNGANLTNIEVKATAASGPASGMLVGDGAKITIEGGSYEAVRTATKASYGIFVGAKADVTVKNTVVLKSDYVGIGFNGTDTTLDMKMEFGDSGMLDMQLQPYSSAKPLSPIQECAIAALFTSQKESGKLTDVQTVIAVLKDKIRVTNNNGAKKVIMLDTSENMLMYSGENFTDTISINTETPKVAVVSDFSSIMEYEDGTGITVTLPKSLAESTYTIVTTADDWDKGNLLLNSKRFNSDNTGKTSYAYIPFTIVADQNGATLEANSGKVTAGSVKVGGKILTSVSYDGVAGSINFANNTIILNLPFAKATDKIVGGDEAPTQLSDWTLVGTEEQTGTVSLNFEDGTSWKIPVTYKTVE